MLKNVLKNVNLYKLHQNICPEKFRKVYQKTSLIKTFLQSRGPKVSHFYKQRLYNRGFSQIFLKTYFVEHLSTTTEIFYVLSFIVQNQH